MRHLHDATEAYLTDIATPVKAFMGNYRDMEAVLWEAISARFNLPKVLPDEIKWADKLALYIEARNLIPSGAEEWEDYQEMSEHIGDTPLACLAPKSARMLFLASYNNYGGMPHYNLNSLVHETHRSIIGSEYASVA